MRPHRASRARATRHSALSVWAVALGLFVAVVARDPAEPAALHAQAAPQAVPEACADGERVASAVRLAHGAFRASYRSALRRCSGPPVCGREVTPSLDRCVTELTPQPTGFRVRILPRAAQGVPSELEVYVDLDANVAQRAQASRSRWAVGRRLAIVGVTEHRIHTHGGAAATIGWARFRVFNSTGGSLPVAAVDGAFVHNDRETPLAALQVEPAVLPEGESELEVRFTPHEAYQSWNDYFWVRARLRVGQQLLAPAAQFHVMRVEPMHPGDR